ncbi:hypothetical protein PR202_ga30753 [Eleusine coracana subsp. coracana]|uniref:Uncharacterized protein n=1 Tax=Eleusine coracana subsp. coracana TaxID=191504 RepID=A0AAV5DP68_ELECO|nr:hypothetical protein PR202_ga30753 [Eleusine coracana subsp. coracana]
MTSSSLSVLTISVLPRCLLNLCAKLWRLQRHLSILHWTLVVVHLGAGQIILVANVSGCAKSNWWKPVGQSWLSKCTSSRNLCRRRLR